MHADAQIYSLFRYIMFDQILQGDAVNLFPHNRCRRECVIRPIKMMITWDVVCQAISPSGITGCTYAKWCQCELLSKLYRYIIYI